MKDPYEDQIKHEGCRKMRSVSGRVDTGDPLVVFLYLLARDLVPMGQLEGILEGIRETSDENLRCMTNGWLAEWAKYTRDRIRND